MAKYMVLANNTLGFPINSYRFEVLSANKDGYYWKNGPVAYLKKDLRPATVEDFNTFRVSLPPDFTDTNT